MPRSLKQILEQANDLSEAFEAYVPRDADERLVEPFVEVREAARARAEAERCVADAVSAAREVGLSWASIGIALGTSGEAARQRYGVTAP